ncbi:redox-regulated ATPase YchF [Candidatus Pelagibacter sp.]|jgi:GTP-binding protein YchF|nr:redox-regulated ATPase YchF [Candidatus Pelagibacter sp.]MDC0899143.1 redox-regulated ATPase YchF [Candidatus Pelagibacter sp.]MDC1132999.1 redox-regulated ATPase YchF [Candidatus Pelagibacter sp.]MDC1167045.1 redox-regulated ATPase YchF [Candidatus Pelagibacter sp.]
MSFKCGIVGLPNVGKSTLFNALTDSSKAQAANFPFCTIDPNVGVVPVPDERLINLAKVSNSKKIINTTISFVDIAGLVKGASKGEGLGNKFLSHIREVDAIIHMIRCFDSDDIQNVNPNVDPIRDLEIIETEMMLADLESIQKRLEKSNKKNVDEEQLKILEIAQDCINNNKDLAILKEQFDKKTLNQSGLLSIKPKIFVCNVDEQSVQNGNQYTKSFIDKFGEENTLIVSADIENQINTLEKEERKNYMEMIGLNQTGLDSLIQKGYKILELDTYFTSGPEETRAWTIEKNCTAPKAAGEIHTDFEKGFIRAETVSYEDFVANEGWVNSKNNGKMRLEGKDYIVKDGDVLNFRFNT